MATDFYKQKFERRIPITGLFVEMLGQRMQAFPEVPSEEDMTEVLASCLADSGTVEKPVLKDVEYVAQELQKRHEEVKDKSEKKGKSLEGKNFAGYFAEWASDMLYDKLCFYVARYDYAKALEYYETYDQQSIVALADEKLRLEFELARVSFEAALFGFGGGYKDTPREGDVMFDLTEGEEGAERALKNMGF